MGLHIDTTADTFTSYRSLAVAPAVVERDLEKRRAESARPADLHETPIRTDSVETRASDTPSLSSALRAAQEAIGLNEEAGRSLGRAYDILVTLRGLVAQGLVDGRPPADTAAEQKYLSLVSELADLGRAAPVHDSPVPTQANLGRVAREVQESKGSGLDTALESVARARTAVATDRHALGRALGTLSVALENGAAAKSRITDAAMAREATELVRTGILGNPRSAVTAQTTTPEEALRLLQI